MNHCKDCISISYDQRGLRQYSGICLQSEDCVGRYDRICSDSVACSFFTPKSTEVHDEPEE